MYLSLIATSMDRRTSQSAHPAFVEIIKQLDGNEAKLLGRLLQVPGAVPIVQIRSTTVGQSGWQVKANHVMGLTNVETKQPTIEPGLAAMVDNWVRLGLIEVHYDQFLEGVDAYAWVEERPEFKLLKATEENDQVKLSYERGHAGRTDFGRMFAEAVGLFDPTPALPASE